MNRMIEIKTPEQAEKINLLASKAPYEVWLSTDTVMLDARSLLGLLSLVCYDILVKVSAFGGTGFGTKERTDPPGGPGPPAGV